MKTILQCPLRMLSWMATLAVATPLWAQTAPADTPVATPAKRVGEATHSLLQRQREGREASTTPRPIDGTVAELGHQRYLKSFEQPLPAWFGSRLDRK